MRAPTLFAAAALAVFCPAHAKVVHRHPVYARAPRVHQGRPYDYGGGGHPELPNDDCDVTNKASMTRRWARAERSSLLEFVACASQRLRNHSNKHLHTLFSIATAP